jgi:hypothetical protein
VHEQHPLLGQVWVPQVTELRHYVLEFQLLFDDLVLLDPHVEQVVVVREKFLSRYMHSRDIVISVPCISKEGAKAS